MECVLFFTATDLNWKIIKMYTDLDKVADLIISHGELVALRNFYIKI